ncbi:signal recognition particle-docking protein FtsY [bacterium]|nr:signal recognition particle-docking protein FtsY [bacterium]
MRKPFSRLREGLAKTRRAITEGIRAALGRGVGLDGRALDSIEETLIAADLGVETAMHLIDALRNQFGGSGAVTEGEVREFLALEIEKALRAAEREGVQGQPGAPLVVMVAGVNGVGKTTTIGKLSRRFGRDERTVILAAADTFRAAASEQLSIWADRSDAQFVAGQLGGDAAAVAYDALDAAIARSADVLIVDTAGRLHTQKNLMQELVKVKRVLGKRLTSAPDEVLLVIDANTGQNALSQARVFDEALGLTGLVLTKLDGTARGGIVVAIARELAIPVRFVGLGEGIDDIEPFDPAAFARGLLGVDEAPSETA